ICHGFISDKQAILESGQNMEEINFNIKNPIITTRKGRPAGRAKNNNNQMSNNNASGSNNNEKDKRKTCQNCGEKGHNRAT
ncbi:12028_t:CDS:2, partial [Rhizophagus irregularis]